ncbi:MAG: CotH kinase family protein [Thermoanaerobaculia bacterium]|nr:CotH kinase family protein [Thermoanaerobaculia bacterium]
MSRRLWAPALAVALMAVFAVAVHGWPPVTQARTTASRSEVPARAFGSKKIRAGLERAGAIHLAPPADLLAAVPADSGTPCPDPAIAVGPLAPEAIPSTRLLPAHWRARDDVPVVSLYLEPCRLQRLLSNPRGRGKDWEEPGWLTLQDGGEVVFQSPVGVRLHGDKTRLLPGPKSFRVYFRPSLGGRPFPGERLAAELVGHELDELILHNDARPDVPDSTLTHRFINPVSYDLARRVGLATPATRPVVMVVNGELTGPVYVLTERLGADWAARRFGHRDFDVLPGRARLETRERELWDGLRHQLLTAPPENFAAVAAELFDFDSLMNWYVLMQLCATDDQLQAALVRDRRGVVAGGRWFVVPWDLDLGFRKRRKHGAPAWQKDNFDFFHRRDPGRRYPLQILVHHLFRNAEDLRRELAERFRTHLDGALRPEIITERLEHYADFARRVPVDDLRFIAVHAEFFRHRPEVVRRQVGAYLGDGKSPARSN